LARERAALAGGVDPRAGRATVRTLSINAVTDREITRALMILTKSGLAESSVRRFRDSLSSYFAWAARERVIATNPVTPTRVPRAGTPRVEMFPFSEDELERIYVRATARDQRLADLLLIDAWTGLRWSELRAMRVRDFVEVPLPILVVQRAEPEGVEIKSTKSGRTRRVPIADRVLPLVRAMAADRDADARLFVTESGHQLHAKAFKRTLAWTTIAEGRRIHDLDTRPRACGWRAELILQPCRRGWGTLRSRPRTLSAPPRNLC
jgi:integrase